MTSFVLVAALLIPGQTVGAEPSPAPAGETIRLFAASPSPAVSPSLAVSPKLRPQRPYSGLPAAPPPAPAKSPVADRWPVEVGLKGGLCRAGIRGDGTEGWEDRDGFCGGGFLFLPLSDYFGLQAELLYVSKGAEYKEDWGGAELKTTLDLAYLEIPLLARLTIPTGISLTPSIFAGPVLGLKVKGDQKAESRGRSTSEEIEGLKSTDLGLTLGGGLDFDTGYGKALVDLRYEFGLTEILDDGGSVKNGAFLAMVGYSLNFWPF